MAAVSLSLRERAQLIYRAISSGEMPTDPGTVGGKLLTGVIQSGGQPPLRGVKELLASYRTAPWVRAIVSRISYDVAAVEWQLFVKPRSKGGRAVRDSRVMEIQKSSNTAWRNRMIKSAVEADELTPVLDHQVLDLLASFNPFHVGISGRRVTQQHMELAGEAFWLMERGPFNIPIYIWPIPPTWILATPSPRRPVYRVSFKGWQGEIPASEMIWFCDLDPANPYGRGVGTAESLADEIETDEYAARHVKQFFFNRMRPDLIVSPKSDDASMTEPEMQRLEQGWAQKSQGFWKAFRPFFMKRAVDVKEIDQSLRAQQFVQLREQERDTCMQVWGVSPEIFGVLGSGNRATISAAEYILASRVTVPRCEFMRSVMQERLIPEFDERLILNYVNPVGRDREQELKAAAVRPEALTVDEWRGRMGEPKLPNGAGEVFLVSPQIEVRNALVEAEPMPALPAIEDLPLQTPPIGEPAKNLLLRDPRA